MREQQFQISNFNWLEETMTYATAQAPELFMFGVVMLAMWMVFRELFILMFKPNSR